RNGTVQQLVVERETDCLNLSALAFSEQLARAANLEVVCRERETGAESLQCLDRLEPFGGVGRQASQRRGDEISVGLMVRSADAPAQLMKLRKTEPVGAIDDDGIRRRYVDAALDDRRAHEHVEASVVEVERHVFECAFRHLAVSHAYR